MWLSLSMTIVRFSIEIMTSATRSGVGINIRLCGDVTLTFLTHKLHEHEPSLCVIMAGAAI